MSDIKTKYPATSSVALTINLASLSSDTTLLAGRTSLVVDNTGNSDLDALLSGVIRAGTAPTVSRLIEIWVYASFKTAAGVPSYPDGITGTDAAKTMTSANVKNSALRLAHSITVDSNTDRDYHFTPVSIASLFGTMPKYWGVFVTQSTGAALNATGAQHILEYERIQAQTV